MVPGRPSNYTLVEGELLAVTASDIDTDTLTAEVVTVTES